RPAHDPAVADDTVEIVLEALTLRMIDAHGVGSPGGAGSPEAGARYSCLTNPRDGKAQARCSPPSRAIIWPVTAGADRRKRTASQISSGVVPRPRGTALQSSSNCSGVCRALGRVGPGPMPLTRMRGAKAIASVRVRVHRPIFETV